MNGAGSVIVGLESFVGISRKGILCPLDCFLGRKDLESLHFFLSLGGAQGFWLYPDRRAESQAGCASYAYLPRLSSGCRRAWRLFLARFELDFLSPASERLPVVTARVGRCWSDKIPEAKEAEASVIWHPDNTVALKRMYFSLRSQSVEQFSSLALPRLSAQELGCFRVFAVHLERGLPRALWQKQRWPGSPCGGHPSQVNPTLLVQLRGPKPTAEEARKCHGPHS